MIEAYQGDGFGLKFDFFYAFSMVVVIFGLQLGPQSLTNPTVPGALFFGPLGVWGPNSQAFGGIG